MARETLYLVQAFKPGQGKKLTAEPAIQCKSTEGARKRAALLAGTKAGVVAFSTSGDAEPGEYDHRRSHPGGVEVGSGRLVAP